ncbi:MAG: CopG family transcriptional regulator [Snowella sp.]|nr:MAG: CopG family transcriptional regulator [Snowella sp.]
MKVEEFDRLFDDGKSIIEYLDLTQIKRSNSEEQIIALEFPSWMIEALNKESQRLNLPLQVIVKGWIEEKLAISNSVQITH